MIGHEGGGLAEIFIWISPPGGILGGSKKALPTRLVLDLVHVARDTRRAIFSIVRSEVFRDRHGLVIQQTLEQTEIIM